MNNKQPRELVLSGYFWISKEVEQSRCSCIVLEQVTEEETRDFLSHESQAATSTKTQTLALFVSNKPLGCFTSPSGDPVPDSTRHQDTRKVRQSFWKSSRKKSPVVKLNAYALYSCRMSHSEFTSFIVKLVC